MKRTLILECLETKALLGALTGLTLDHSLADASCRRQAAPPSTGTGSGSTPHRQSSDRPPASASLGTRRARVVGGHPILTDASRSDQSSEPGSAPVRPLQWLDANSGNAIVRCGTMPSGWAEDIRVRA